MNKDQIMDNTNDIIISPEIEALKQQCLLLRDELVSLLAEREHLVGTVGPNILAIYATTVGVKEYEALCLDVEVRRLKATIEKIQALENQGKKPNLEQIEAAVEDELQAWKDKVDKMVGEIQASAARLKNQMSDADSAELLKLYRSLAKKLHPDLNPALTDKHKMLWAKVQQAYANGGLQEMRALVLMVDDAPDDIQMPNQIDTLQKRFGQLKDQAASLLQQLDNIRNSPPHTLAEKVMAPDWVLAQTSKCEKRIIALTEQKTTLEAWLFAWKGIR